MNAIGEKTRQTYTASVDRRQSDTRTDRCRVDDERRAREQSSLIHGRSVQACATNRAVQLEALIPLSDDEYDVDESHRYTPDSASGAANRFGQTDVQSSPLVMDATIVDASAPDPSEYEASIADSDVESVFGEVSPNYTDFQALRRLQYDAYSAPEYYYSKQGERLLYPQIESAQEAEERRQREALRMQELANRDHERSVQLARREALRRRKEIARSYVTNDSRHIKRQSGAKLRSRTGPQGEAFRLESDDEYEPQSSSDDEYYGNAPDRGTIYRVGRWVSSLGSTVTNLLFTAPDDTRHGAPVQAAIVERDEHAAIAASRQHSASSVSRSQESAAPLELDLQRDLGCSSVREAVERRVPVAKLRQCNIDPMDFKRQSLSIEDLLSAKWTLNDAKSLNIVWRMLVDDMGLRANHLTRKNGWWDLRVLADCVVREQADLIVDLGFTLEDVFRLECQDRELAQLMFTMDDLLNRLHLTRKAFLALPWHFEVMVNLLQMDKSHLVALRIGRPHLQYLVLKRKWPVQGLIDELGMSQQELHKAGLDQSLSDLEKEYAARAKAEKKKHKHERAKKLPANREHSVAVHYDDQPSDTRTLRHVDVTTTSASTDVAPSAATGDEYENEPAPNNAVEDEARRQRIEKLRRYEEMREEFYGTTVR